ncbi:MAG: hypothetical protein FWG96_06290 [Methanomassiliicoccaceae archaeon]|nr:hypothetical protein [Methanomassiliicoccaceae archaeon]
MPTENTEGDYENTFEFKQYSILFIIRDLLSFSKEMIAENHEEDPVFLSEMLEMVENRIGRLTGLIPAGP